MKKLVSLVLALSMGLTVFGASSFRVSDVSAAQRYPWNGKVDITFTVTALEGEGPYDVYLSVADTETTATYQPKTLTVGGANVTATGGKITVPAGEVKVVWDAGADMPNNKNFPSMRLAVMNGAVTVDKIIEFGPEYLAFNLENGTYCGVEPDMSNGTAKSPDNTDFPRWGEAYKTTYLLLRRIPACPNGFPFQGNSSSKAKLTKPYYLGVFPVTQKQYELIMGSDALSGVSYRGDANPMNKVTWADIRGASSADNTTNGSANWPTKGRAVDANSFVGMLRAKFGFADTVETTFDLPTSTEWEHACRAGTTTTYYWGNGAPADNMDYITREMKVGNKRPNDWGLYDMVGCVYEWILDWYDGGWNGVGKTDYKGADTGWIREIRGGCYWLTNNQYDQYPSSWRGGRGLASGSEVHGFRIAFRP